MGKLWVDYSNKDDMYRIIDDIIYYKGRIFLILESTLKMKIIQASHDSPLLGHQGFLKTYRKIRERFSWKGLKGEVMQHVRECSICQQNKVEHIHPAGLLQSLPILEQKRESISIDFITTFPKVQG